MRLCIVCSLFHPHVGGHEQKTASLGAYLAKKGHRVLVLASRYPSTALRSETFRGMEVVRLPIGSLGFWGKTRFLFELFFSLLQRRREWDVIFVVGPWEPLWLTVLFARFARKPVVCRITHREIFQSWHYPHAGLWYGFLRVLLKNWVARYVVQYGRMEEDLKSYGVEPEKIRIVKTGIDTQRFCPASPQEKEVRRKALGVRGGPVVAFIGRLSDRKSPDTLVAAWPRVLEAYPQARLLLIGSGPLREPCREMARAQGIEHAVTFVDPTTEVLDYYRCLDVYVNCSPIEGESNTILEALSCGLLTVVSDIPENRTMVTHGENGLVFRVRDSKHLADTLVEALKDPGRTAALAARARAYVLENHDLEKTGRSMEQLLENLLKGTP